MKFVLVLTLLLLAGCQNNIETQTKQFTGELSSKLTYFVDTRTGLCFASIGSLAYAFNVVTSIAAVPCTEKVLAEAKK